MWINEDILKDANQISGNENYKVGYEKPAVQAELPFRHCRIKDYKLEDNRNYPK